PHMALGIALASHRDLDREPFRLDVRLAHTVEEAGSEAIANRRREQLGRIGPCRRTERRSLVGGERRSPARERNTESIGGLVLEVRLDFRNGRDLHRKLLPRRSPAARRDDSPNVVQYGMYSTSRANPEHDR